MKEHEALVDCPEQQMILYVEKEDGNYGPTQTGSYLSANYLDDYFLKKRNLEASLRKQLSEGEISPVKYYMVLVDLSLSELASRTGIRKSKVLRHCTAAGFQTLTVDELRRYAAVFNVPMANMLQVILLKVNDLYEPLIILEQPAGDITVGQRATGNPCITETIIEKRIG